MKISISSLGKVGWISDEKGYRYLTKEEKAAAAEKKRTSPIRDKSTKIADEKNHIKAKNNILQFKLIKNNS